MLYSTTPLKCQLPHNIKAADSVQNSAISKGVYLTILTINICPLSILHKALLNNIGGKGYIKYQLLLLLLLLLCIERMHGLILGKIF